MDAYTQTAPETPEGEPRTEATTPERDFQQALRSFYQALNDLTGNATPYPPF